MVLVAQYTVLLGVVGVVVGGIWLLVAAFRENPLWAVLMFFVPIVGLIFALTNWEVAKRPFLIELAGFGLIFVGALLGGVEQ